MGSDSSSEDEDEEHKARMRSVAIDSSAVINIAAGRGADNSTAKLGSKRKKKPDGEEDFDEDGGLKFAQIRVVPSFLPACLSMDGFMSFHVRFPVLQLLHHALLNPQM